MSKIILDTEDFFQNDGYDDLMHIDHESYCCGEMFEKYETKISDLEAKLKALQNGIIDDETLNMLVKEHKLYKDLEAKLAESEKKAYSRGHSQRDIANEIKLNALREDVANKEKRIVELKQQLAEKDKEIEKLKKQVQEKDLLYKSLLAMATQLNDVYDTEGCMYGDEISGDTPEETANAYIEETKKKLREKNNG